MPLFLIVQRIGRLDSAPPADPSLEALGAAAILVLGTEGPAWRMPAPGSGTAERIEAPSPLAAARAFWEEATAAGAAVLVAFGTVTIDTAALQQIVHALHRDPLNGFAAPRLSPDPDGHWIYRLHPAIGDHELPVLPSAILQHLPDDYRFTEHTAACMLVRAEVVSNFGPLDESVQTVLGALTLLMHRARRAGFRSIVTNRTVIHAKDQVAAPHPARENAGAWRAHIPDWQAAWRWYASAPEHTAEAFLARQCHPSPAVSKTLLLDATSLAPRYNGIAESVLSLLEGLDRIETDVPLTVAVHPEAAAFHRFSERLRRIEILPPDRLRRYSVGIRLSQPWSFHQVHFLHRVAARNLFLMHDTIAWDIVYPAPPGLDEVWQTTVRVADALVFNSDFTCERCVERLPAPAPPRPYVLRFPTAPEAYRSATGPRPVTEPYVFVVGNHLDHKALPQTVRTLGKAFPDLRIVALGYEDASVPNLTGLPSGRLSDAQVEALYAHAEAVVFPSHYEGFGFPMMRGLAYGRTVFVRRSALVDELAAHYRGPGCLVDFTDDKELVGRITAWRTGAPLPTVPFSAALSAGQEPDDWAAVAHKLLKIVEDLASTPDPRRWMERERMFRALTAFHREHSPQARAQKN